MPKGIPASGSRKPGAGPKKGNKEPTTTIAFRVPIKDKDLFKEIIKNLIDNYPFNLKPLN